MLDSPKPRQKIDPYPQWAARGCGPVGRSTNLPDNFNRSVGIDLGIDGGDIVRAMPQDNAGHVESEFLPQPSCRVGP